jgi:hypothetical protein
LQEHDLLGGQLRILLRVEVARPILRELIAAVLGDEQAAGGIEGKAFAVAQPRGVALRRREMLILFVGVVPARVSSSVQG